MKVSEIKSSSILTKSNTPLGGYCANPYTGCPHGCRYCYASFMSRFTGHTAPWGTYVDIKTWDPIKDPAKYNNDRILIGSVTDPYNPYEAEHKRTRALLEQLIGTTAEITIITKSDLILRDMDLLKQFKSHLTLAWSINTLDEKFRDDMDNASTIKARLTAMKKFYDAGFKTVCFISPIFPGLTNIFEIIEAVKNQCDFVWLENLNLRGAFRSDILNYIATKHLNIWPTFKEVYCDRDLTYWKNLEVEVEKYCKENKLQLLNNHMPDGRGFKGKPIIINYFYHEEVKGTNNTGTRNKKN